MALLRARQIKSESQLAEENWKEWQEGSFVVVPWSVYSLLDALQLRNKSEKNAADVTAKRC